ncbi:hypothetical protein QFZ42_003351 [Variovorax paradoxus]|uniref:hypothetical protein n=1 Tax=Variovorax paradoxus TaxID=34073 RepID=UPI00278E71E9|nr:hypothetical protein [Variovorax paradoxus]MDQ0571517.1 hypothetical protein [Variovorax paradoxus]
MAKQIVKGIVHYCKEVWDDHATYEIFPFDMSEHGGRVVIGARDFEIDVPDDFNPVPQMVAALEEQKRQIRLEMGAKLARIDEKISKLTCIEHTVEAV